jgi:transcription elongation factor GreA
LSPRDARENPSLTLGEAISAYVAHAPPADRELAFRELSRFGHALGMDTPVAQLTTEQVFQYQAQFAASKADVNLRLAPVKAFLTRLNKQQATTVNLGAFVQLRRPSVRRRARRGTGQEPAAVLMTQQGYALLTEELRDLEERVRPEVTEQLRSAAADKDFSENAPYSAAKHRLSEVRTRINRIRRMLAAATVYVGDSTETVDLGTVVTLHSLNDDEQVVYGIVGAGERLGNGRVSIQSPVGSALVTRRVGEVVEVQTPSGLDRYRIEKIERR